MFVGVGSLQDIEQRTGASAMDKTDLSKLAFYAPRFTGREDLYRAGSDRSDGVQPSQGPEGRPPNVSPARKGWDRWTMILSTVGAALYPNLISLFQVAAQVRPIKSTQQNRSIG